MAEEPEEQVEETPAGSEPEAPAEPKAISEDATDSEAIGPEADAAPSQAEARPAEEAAASSEPAAPDSPKDRRRLARAEKAAAAPTRPQRSPQERQAERDAERAQKAATRRKWRSRQRQKARTARAQAPAREPLAPRLERHPGQQKTRQGVVVSDRAAKTITVRIDVTRRHPRYSKIVRTSRTLHVHDEKGEAHVGDTVIVRESRPLSRTKRWRLVEVVERAR